LLQAITRDPAGGAGVTGQKQATWDVAWERHADARPVFGPSAAAMDGLLDRYSDAELALLLDVADRANAITME
jgi:hypothetical protein